MTRNTFCFYLFVIFKNVGGYTINF